jgi:tetraacyldisaccharide 4'-kinase
MQLIGDEPFQIKNKFKDLSVAVCEKRVEGIEKLTAEDPELQVILLDDAYQHRYVNAGLKILLIDSNRPVWKDNVMPFGRLRESIGGIRRADIVIITKCRELTPRLERCYKEQIKRYKEMPVYFSTVQYGMPYAIFGNMTEKAEITTGSRILLVTGIAGPQPLKAEIEKRGAEVTLMQYPDHHDFSTADLTEIAKRYRALDCSMILTTEKDATRLLNRNDIPGQIRDSIYALPIEIKILNGEEDMFNQNIIDYVTENSRNR